MKLLGLFSFDASAFAETPPKIVKLRSFHYTFTDDLHAFYDGRMIRKDILPPGNLMISCCTALDIAKNVA